ncbi:hypothetical protein [Georgenia thermotolerans]|uniref:DUF2398 family protein n=1 Tax=Georgenia thermotolerans TaxID=527326 RepID=A0A7J5UNX9_9MICO|nr:hypothetical protein [Georgenia thermotolerans]KAE8763814.1 hypothetical protein GB883_12155 [Georgenia thermotolerans]
MPKKKPKPRKTPSQRRRHQGPPPRHVPAAAVPALLAELEEWARELDLLIEDSTWLVERAIDLKREQLGSPDPTAWTEPEIRAVLTELFPRAVAATGDDARLLVPAMTLFFSFLLSTGRFRSPLTDARLTALMEELAGQVPQAFEGGAEGEEREPFADIWPPALGPAPDLDALSEGPFEAADVAAWFEGSVLLPRARAFVAWVGAGRPVTSTGALRPADTAEVLHVLGFPEAVAPRSMWQDRELVLLWVALVRLGYLHVGASRVTPGEEALPAPDASPEAVAGAAAALHAAVLHAFLEANPGEPTYALEPDLTLGALLRAAEPGGLTVTEPGEDVLVGDEGLTISLLRTDLDLLARVGVLEQEGDTFRFPEPLHPVLPAALHMLGGD